jgi:hypothetical protein
MSYLTNEQNAGLCNEKTSNYRTLYDKTYINVYNKISLESQTMPPLYNKEMMENFLGTPTSLNLISNVTEKYTPCRNCLNKY